MQPVFFKLRYGATPSESQPPSMGGGHSSFIVNATTPMTRASVSIALCTWNGERYLTEQLASLAAQTRLPDELVVCDDASEDGSLAILERFARQAPFPVRVHVNQENIGSTKNFESAIRFCQGGYIFLADQDDVWKSHKIERLVRVLEDDPRTAFVFSDAVLVDGQRRPLEHSLWKVIDFNHSDRASCRDGRLFFTLLRRNVVTGAAMAFRSEFRRLLLPIPDGWVHDEWIALILAGHGDGSWVTEPLIEYRQHPAQQIGAALRTPLEQFHIARNMDLPRFEKEACRFSCARDRLRAAMEMMPERIDALDEKVAHCLERCRMRREKRWRFPAVIREALTGRYFRYSQGWKAICQDVFLQ